MIANIGTAMLRGRPCAGQRGTMMIETTTANAWQGRYVTSRRGDALHVWLAAEDRERPALIACHGFSDAGACMQPVAAHWLARYRVVLPDARGHGLSARSHADLPADTELDDLEDILGALQIEHAILIGHSMGAATVVRFAARHPGRVRGLILEDPPWRDTPAPPPGRRSWFEVLRRKPLPELERLAQRLYPTWSAAERGPWAASKPQLDPHAAALLRRVRAADSAGLTSRLDCPGLLLTADPQRGALVSRARAARVREAWPQCREVCIDDAGHNIRREQPRAYLEAVEAFLATLAP